MGLPHRTIARKSEIMEEKGLWNPRKEKQMLRIGFLHLTAVYLTTGSPPKAETWFSFSVVFPSPGLYG